VEKTLAVIGAGPAGLRAAEVAVNAGVRVVVFDAKASAGRKFLVAGSGGLNLTKDEPVERFASLYRGPEMPEGFWQSRMAEFGPEQLRAWAAELGVETFAASTGRVYPKEMKAAPLLRAWIRRLRGAGVKFAMHHRWLGWKGDALIFETPDGVSEECADAVVLTLGGGSWPETGSDGTWAEILSRQGIVVAPLQSANCGWEVDWPADLLARAEGKPLKNVVVSTGGEAAAGELMITRYGLEGGAIYQLGAALRAMAYPEIAIDLKPALSEARLIEKLGPARRNFLAEAKQRWRLGEAAEAILDHRPERDSWTTSQAMARAVKACRVPLLNARPIAEAISSAGGVRWAEVDGNLMLRRLPGVFVAGEMVDWEAPTGGYLMQGAFATGGYAARGALEWLRGR